MKDLLNCNLQQISLMLLAGNELCGKGVSASVGAEQYGKDSIRLKAMINELYANSQPRPPLLAPGGFYDKSWFDKLLQVSGPHVVNVLTHHMYSLGPGGFLLICIESNYYVSNLGIILDLRRSPS